MPRQAESRQRHGHKRPASRPTAAENRLAKATTGHRRPQYGQRRPRRGYLLRGQPSVRRSLPGFKHTLTTASAGGYPPSLSNVPLLVNSPWTDPTRWAIPVSPGAFSCLPSPGQPHTWGGSGNGRHPSFMGSRFSKPRVMSLVRRRTLRTLEKRCAGQPLESHPLVGLSRNDALVDRLRIDTLTDQSRNDPPIDRPSSHALLDCQRHDCPQLPSLTTFLSTKWLQAATKMPICTHSMPTE